MKRSKNSTFSQSRTKKVFHFGAMHYFSDFFFLKITNITSLWHPNADQFYWNGDLKTVSTKRDSNFYAQCLPQQRGIWSEWESSQSSCSKSCGGGVLYEYRICRLPPCDGDSFRLSDISCNKKECPEKSPSCFYGNGFMYRGRKNQPIITTKKVYSNFEKWRNKQTSEYIVTSYHEGRTYTNCWHKCRNEWKKI